MKLLLLCQIAIQLAALTRGNILVQLKFTVCNYYYAAQVVPTSYSFSVTDAVSGAWLLCHWTMFKFY